MSIYMVIDTFLFLYLCDPYENCKCRLRRRSVIVFCVFLISCKCTLKNVVSLNLFTKVYQQDYYYERVQGKKITSKLTTQTEVVYSLATYD